MEYVDFYPKTFSEIPEQDNPAFEDNRPLQCLMITKEAAPSKRSIVVQIDAPDPIETVTHVAAFERHNDAVRFCKALCGE